jgi:hypothetical protein
MGEDKDFGQGTGEGKEAPHHFIKRDQRHHQEFVVGFFFPTTILLFVRSCGSSIQIQFIRRVSNVFSLSYSFRCPY